MTIFWLISALWAAEPTTPGKTQVWTSVKEPSVQVRLLPSKRRLSVQLDSADSSHPQGLQIILMDSAGNTRTLELRPMPLPARPGMYGVNWTDTSPGMLPEVAVAFELRIPLPLGKTRSLRSENFERRSE